MSKPSITVFDLGPATKSSVSSVEAALEINEFDEPFAVEVLQLQRTIGEHTTRKLLTALAERQLRFSYDSEVDALTFTFGVGTRTVGQRLGTLHIELTGDQVSAVRLTQG